jgi:hypothetical protein
MAGFALGSGFAEVKPACTRISSSRRLSSCPTGSSALAARGLVDTTTDLKSED